MKKILVSVFMLLLLPIHAAGQEDFFARGVRLFKLIVSDDYLGAVSGKKHVFSWGMHDYEFDTQARFLAREYRDDAEQANAKYINKWIRINGPTDRIGLDRDGKPFVDLGVFSDSSADIRATFVSESALYAGREGPMICQVTGARSGRPMLNYCRYQYLVGSEYNVPPFVDQPINDWLSTGVPPWFATQSDQRKILFVSLFVADHLPPNSPCSTTAMTIECGDSFVGHLNRLVESPTDDFRSSYQAYQVMLGLPPIRK